MSALPLRRPLRTAFAALLFLFALFALARPARADDPVVESPRDVPLVVQPSAVTIPPVPVTFEQHDLGWLKIAYPPGARERVASILRDADQVKADLEQQLGQGVLEHVDVRIAHTPDEMSSLSPTDVRLPHYASGVTLPSLHYVLLTMRAPSTDEGTDLDEVFRHELAHVALADALAGRRVPTWFNEGFAIRASGESPWLRRESLMNATLSKTVIPLSDLDTSFPERDYETSLAYAEAGDVVRFLLRDADRERFASLVERVRKGQTFDRAMTDAYGIDSRKLEFEWREELAKRYTFWPVLTGGSFVWVMVLGAMLYGWMKKRRRDKLTLSRWAEEEAAADLAARRPVVTFEETAMDPSAMRQASEPPKIEHDGAWHTLH